MKGFKVSLKKLGLEYFDLYLIHWPAVPRWHDDWREINRSTWRAFEELYQDGRIKAIGVSNFLAHQEIADVFDCLLSKEDMVSIDRLPYCGGMMLDPDSARS